MDRNPLLANWNSICENSSHPKAISLNHHGFRRLPQPLVGKTNVHQFE
jgi:hypothetical protein